jgi:hypothetical protein
MIPILLLIIFSFLLVVLTIGGLIPQNPQPDTERDLAATEPSPLVPDGDVSGFPFYEL